MDLNMKNIFQISIVLLWGLVILSPVNAQDVQETKEIALRFFNGFWNGEDLSVLDELLAPGFINYAVSNKFEGSPRTPELYRNTRKRFDEAMPDLKYTLEDVIVEPGKAVLYTMGSFTHTNTFSTRHFGEAKANGQKVSYAVIFIYWISEGKIVKGVVLHDAITRYEGMGVFPEY